MWCWTQKTWLCEVGDRQPALAVGGVYPRLVSGGSGGKLELDHMRAENANLLRDLATSHKFVEVLKQRIEQTEKRDKERIQQLQQSMAEMQGQVACGGLGLQGCARGTV